MAGEEAADGTKREGIRKWQARYISARDAQHLQELMRRHAGGEFSTDKVSAAVRRVLKPLLRCGQGED